MKLLNYFKNEDNLLTEKIEIILIYYENINFDEINLKYHKKINFL